MANPLPWESGGSSSGSKGSGSSGGSSGAPLPWESGGSTAKSSGGSSSAKLPWEAGTTGASTASTKSGGGHGLFGSITHGIAAAVTGAPGGFLHFAHDIVTSPYYYGRDVVAQGHHVPFTPYKPGQEEAINQRLAKDLPALYGGAAGLGQTINEAGGRRLLTPAVQAQTTSAAKAYKTDPVGAFLNDAANISLVGGGAGKVLGGAAEGAESAKLGTAAEALSRGGEIAGKVAAAPLVPFTAPLKLIPALGESGLSRVMAAAAEGEQAPRWAGVAARLSPAFGQLTQTILGGQANEEAVREQQGRLAIQVHKIIPSPVEQQAAIAVGEHIAPAIAAVRDHLTPERFDAYVNQRFGGTLTPESAHLAADVVQGRNPEVAARIDQALKLGSEATGGRQELTQRYVEAKPGREWQGGFDPNPRAVADATAPFERGLAKAEPEAAQARLRATLHAPGEVEPAAARVGTNPTGRLEAAVGRVRNAAAEVDRVNQLVEGATSQVRDRAMRDVRGSLVDEVKNYRRSLVDSLRNEASDMEGRVADVGQPERVGKYLRQSESLFGDKRTAHPMADVANQLREGLGHGYAERSLFARSGAGIPLDVWLEDWNRRNSVVPQITSGADLGRVAEHVTSHINAARELRRQASSLIGRGVEGRLADQLSGGDPEAHLYLSGTPAEAAAAIEVHQGLGASAGQGVVSQMSERAARASAGEEVPNLTPAERRMVQAAGAVDAHAAAAGNLEQARAGTISRLTEAGRTAGRTQGRAEGAAAVRGRVYENLARSAETRVARLRAGMDSARSQAESAITSAPARLRPMLGENRAAASELVGTVNELRRQGLPDAAKNVEDAIAQLPQSLTEAKAAGVDAEHFFHTQEGKNVKGGAPRGNSLPRTFTPGSEKLRTGSPMFDRTIEGQRRGAVEVQVAAARQATADKIAKMPFAARLGEGPLAEARTLEDAKAAGYVPWNPSSPFDTQGRVTPLGEFDKALGTPHGTVFLPKPIFDQFRSYFEPRKGELWGLVLDVPNRLNFIGKLALSPAAIVGRVFGHALLGFASTDHPAQLGHNIIRAISDYRASGADGAPRHFEAPQRLLHAGATSAELDRLNRDVRDPTAGLRAKVQGASSALNRVITKPFKVTSFLDNAMRSAYYLTEKATGATEDGALQSALRALGEFDRMSPTERDYVRRIVPFWAWHRELTRIAFHLAEDHPLRVAWTLHMGNVAGQPDSPLPSWASSTLPVGKGTLAGTRLLFPFGEVADTVGGGLLGTGKMLGPVPRFAYGVATGQNPSTGKAFSHPYAQADFSGNRPGANIVPALRNVARTLPQERLFEALTGSDKVARYDTGQPIMIGPKGQKAPLTNVQPRFAGLASYLGVPLTDRADAEAYEQKQLEKYAKAHGGSLPRGYVRNSQHKIVRKPIFGQRPSGDVADTLPYATR